MPDDTASLAPSLATGPDDGAAGGDRCRFEPAPPRNFLFPAILLLVREQPGNGYGLVKRLGELTFGRVDRPTVYRALAKLEAERLVESWQAEERPGSPCVVYGITRAGTARLGHWMQVVAAEARLLEGVLDRYARWAVLGGRPPATPSARPGGHHLGHPAAGGRPR